MGWMEVTGHLTNGQILADIGLKPDDVVAKGSYGTTLYVAYRSQDRVRGLVVLVRRTSTTTSYKTMDEEMGPFYYDAPKKVLDALSPLDPVNPAHTSALQWRERCVHRAEQVKLAARLLKGLKYGDQFVLRQELRFRDCVLKEGTVVRCYDEKKLFFSASNVSFCFRISKKSFPAFLAPMEA